MRPAAERFRSSRAGSSSCRVRRCGPCTRPPAKRRSISPMRRRSARASASAFSTLGMSPLWTRAETPVMPKARYRIMTDYMPKVGSLGLDMMYRTSTVQVNMDYASEADMVKKLRVSLALQPVATAIFANSPFTDGKPNGYLSMRSNIWLDTDKDRTGMMAFAFEEGFGYERLRRLGARRADVFRQARCDLSRCRWRVVPRSLRGQARAIAGRARDALRLGESRLDPFSGSAPQALSRDARRGRGQCRTYRGSLRLLDRTSLRRDVARRGLGTGEILERRGSRAAACRRAEAGAEGAHRRTLRAGCGAGRAGALARRPAAPRLSRTIQVATRRAISPMRRRSSRPAARRRSVCWSFITVGGTARCMPAFKECVF